MACEEKVVVKLGDYATAEVECALVDEDHDGDCMADVGVPVVHPKTHEPVEPERIVRIIMRWSKAS